MAREPQKKTRTIIAGALAFSAVAAALDETVSEQYSLRMFHLPALMAITWLVGSRWAIGFALLAAYSGPIVAAVEGKPDTQYSVLFWESLNRFALFAALVVLGSMLQISLKLQRRFQRRDALTGLANSKAFLEQVDAELNRSKRTGRPVTVAFLDCDGFKSINDSLGHLTGDDLLKTVASTLRAVTRSYDVVARGGGDEFALLLPESDSEMAKAVIERVREKLREAMQSQSWPVTFSIGVASFYTAEVDAVEAVRTADNLMYDVKKAGKNDVLYQDIREPTADTDL